MVFYVACARGVEVLLQHELAALGLSAVATTKAGVRVNGSLHAAQRVVLWSRLASRVIWPLQTFACDTADALYAAVSAIRWETHLAVDHTLAVDAHVSQSTTLRNSHFAALRVKDAVADQMRAIHGQRPSVDRVNPAVRLHLVVHRHQATLSIDLSGGPMHRRGWRRAGYRAPLKETLAAAVVRATGWAEVFQQGGGVVDPMCGSGTLLIEAALLAADVAPGLQRLTNSRSADTAAPTQWRGFDQGHWQMLLADARSRAQHGLATLPAVFYGIDCDRQAIAAANANALAAGVAAAIHWQTADCARATYPNLAHGVVVANLPYDARIEADAGLYRSLGQTLRRHLPHWRAGLLCGDRTLAAATGLTPQRCVTLSNGPLTCCFIVTDPAPAPAHPAAAANVEVDAAGVEMVANRLRKNQRALRRWLDRTGISCYRVYDADLPDYAAAVDVYQAATDGNQRYLHIQEYAAPAHIPAEDVCRRRAALQAAVQEVFQVPAENIALKFRQRQHHQEGRQYQRLGDGTTALHVREQSALLRVNLFDYLDTGLFLDLRQLRARLSREAVGRRFLNLFCYTGAASVQAALAGAATTTSVDLSATYLHWCSDNFSLNGQTGPRHRLIQADVMTWLRAEQASYDVIFCDPPTFSNSARSTDFDIQRHHVALLALAISRLTADGVLYFSNHFRRFKLDQAAINDFADCEEITAETRDRDFNRDPRIHRAWRLQPRRH